MKPEEIKAAIAANTRRYNGSSAAARVLRAEHPTITDDVPAMERVYLDYMLACARLVSGSIGWLTAYEALSIAEHLLHATWAAHPEYRP